MDLHDETTTKPLGLTLIGVPSSAGARRTGQERAPVALRAAGLAERLRDLGLDVVDQGDLPCVTFRPDETHPRQQNLDRVVDVARQTADRVDRIVAGGRLPIVLGGDCSLSLGVIAGLLRHRPRLGLMYFDGDLDLETPETTPSGIFDGMVMAHALGRGAPLLAGIGPRRPLLSEEDVVLFGYNLESGWTDPPELEALGRSRSAQYPVARVRQDAAAAANEALRGLAGRADAILVHFDVDVMDFPAADLPHPNALDPEAAFAALAVFVASPRCAGLVVTEFNVERDPDGSGARRLVDGLAGAFAGRRGRAA